MKELKVVVAGEGGVGGNLVELLSQKKGLKLAGVVDIDPAKVGKDAGEVAGCGKIGVTVVDDLGALLDEVKPDVVINTIKPSSAEETFEQMKPALMKQVNVLVANMGTCNLWSTDLNLAKDIDKMAKENGVSYLGMGATHMQDRFILSQTEGCSKIDNISFTHFADMHAFSDHSVKHEWGVLLSEDEFKKGVKDGSVEGHEYFKDGIYYLGAHLGWNIDDVSYDHTPMVKDGFVYGVHFKIQGFSDKQKKLETNWIFLRDPERKYYDRVVVEGTPRIDSINNFTPDRGIVSTYASLANAIPVVIKAEPGYINSLIVPSCTLIDDEYTKHI